MNSQARSRRRRKRHDSSTIVCPECGETQAIHSRKTGEKVCTQCGLVISDRHIDTGPEWRAFTAEERDSRARTGGPSRYTSHDKGLSTSIGWDRRDSSGRTFSGQKRAKIYRLRKWQIRTRLHGSVERNLQRAMIELNRLTSQLGLKSSVKELAAMLYRKAIVTKRVRSRPIEGLIAASLYAACRIRRIPRSLKSIAKQSPMSKKKIGQLYRLLVRKMKLRMPVPDPFDYVPKLVSNLSLPSSIQETVLEILQKAKDKFGLITGRDPRGIAASAIYIASILTDNPVTQREVARVAGVTEVTIRNRYKELVRELEIVPVFR